MFRNGALRSTAPGSWSGRPRLRGHVLSDLTRPAECVDGQRRPRPRQCRSRRQGIRGGYSAYAIGHIPCGIGRDSRRMPARRPKAPTVLLQYATGAHRGNPSSPGPSWPMGSGLQPRPAASLAFFALRPGAIKWTAVRFRWLRGPATIAGKQAARVQLRDSDLMSTIRTGGLPALW